MWVIAHTLQEFKASLSYTEFQTRLNRETGRGVRNDQDDFSL